MTNRVCRFPDVDFDVDVLVYLDVDLDMNLVPTFDDPSK
jgi:hypothetical protein